MFFLIIIIITILTVYKSWLGINPISSGDLSFFYKEQITEYINLPFYWETFRNVGLGGRSFLHLGVYLYNLPLGLLGKYFSYGVSERIVWFFPILIIGFISPLVMAKELNLFSKKIFPLCSFIFLLNTYFLMIVSGGQLTIMLGYVFVPLAIALIVGIFNNFKLYKVIFFSLIFSLIVAWDFRIAYIFLIFITLYLFWELIFANPSIKRIEIIKKAIYTTIITSIITLGTHSYWIIPFVIYFKNPVASLSSAYTTNEAVRFFSFADFSHTFSLLHPNWPENIFGKTYFLQPEFLLIPIIAFLSLLLIGCIKEKNNLVKKNILFFSIIGIIGAFLAKGTNGPFGLFYNLLFSYFPGFIMFRDPTKWYLLIIISYIILIPFTVDKAIKILKESKKYKFFSLLILPFVFIYFVLLIRPAIEGNLRGTLTSVNVPQDYLNFKKNIYGNPDFFRTFWIPTTQRFSYYDFNHPAMSAQDYFNTNDPVKTLKLLSRNGQEEELSRLGVKYIVIPFDSERNIFLTDRKYDPKKRLDLEKNIEKISWIKNKKRFGGITYFELEKPKNHFWVDNASLMSYKMINPTKYLLQGKSLVNTKIIFSEFYDPLWTLTINNNVISSNKIFGNINSFTIRNKGEWEAAVEFTPQKKAVLWLGISMGIFFLSVLLLIFTFYKKI